MFDYSYKHTVKGAALVLGGSGGIGYHVTKALVANGASAIAFTYGGNKPAAEKLKAEIEAVGIKVYCASVSLRSINIEAFKKFLDDAVLALGEEFTTMVNSVGISPDVAYHLQTPELWRDVYDVVTVGCEFSSRAVADRMVARGIRGNILWITSTNGQDSNAPFSSPYDSAKSGQERAMMNNGMVYAPLGVRVTAISPGWINTHMNDTVPPEEMAKELGMTWVGEIGQPEMLACTIAHAVGTDDQGRSYIYGENWQVDGGYPRRP